MDCFFNRNFGEPIMFRLVTDDGNVYSGHIIEHKNSQAEPFTIEFNDEPEDVASVNDRVKSEYSKWCFIDPTMYCLSNHALYDAICGYANSEVKPEDISALKNIYDKLIRSVAILRAIRNNRYDEQKVNNRVDKIISWLESTDFYTAPASTRYHETFEGGLLYHTLCVVANIIAIGDSAPFANNVNIEDAVLVALVHDWCKIGKYKSYQRNVKNEDTGTWEKVTAYKYQDSVPYPLGHGVTSAYIANKFFNLKIEEFAAIEFHMGRWEAGTDYQQNDMQQANETIPLCYLLQFADQLACTKYWYKS